MIIVVTKTPEFIGVIERWMVLAPCLRPFHVRELVVSGGLMTNGFDAQHLKASMDGSITNGTTLYRRMALKVCSSDTREMRQSRVL